MKSEILQKALDSQPYLTAAKSRIHSVPELGMEEFETTAFIRSELESMDIPMKPLAGDVGVLGIIEGKRAGAGKTIALRADIDALPIQETADVPDKSTVPGVMHACGHDAHAAMLLGAAKLLSSMREGFSGTVKLLFQPAEEGLGGARYMIESGALEGPRPDFVLGIHGHNGFNVGEIAFRNGPSMASSDLFTVTIKGKSGHGAYPHRIGSDPVQAASSAIMALQSIVTRQIDAIDSVVLSVCEIHGGSAKNIIPETVQFGGTVRCQSPETRNSMKERMEAVVKASAAAYLCAAELDYSLGVPPLVNDPEVADLARE
ncbi:MAG: amidohydrolase, partial [Synergistaceae bacterium]|nr:amidohydrolase [Synergistaceae bacterium]